MNLIERYVQAVKTYLPAKLRDDVGEELQSLLNEKADDIRDANGGELPNESLLELLRSQGHPMTVAARYQEPQVLVSDSLFPFYLHALKWVAGILVGIQVLTWALNAINGVGTGSIVRLVINSFDVSIYAFAYTTLFFYFFGKILEQTGIFNKWNPGDLPALRTDWSYEPRGESIFSIIVTLLFLAFINGVTGVDSENFAVQASPEFAALLLWANVIFVGSVIWDVEKLFRPLHTLNSSLIALVLSVTTLVLLGYIISLDSTIEIRLGNKEFSALPKYVWSITLVIIFAVDTFPILRRLWKMKGV